MSTKIAILGHWHTGTTLLAKQLAACGMEVGNEKTFWDDDCVAQCEHSELNGIGNQMVLAEHNTNYHNNRIREILDAYKKEASHNGWEYYGVKITHALHRPSFDTFISAFRDSWGYDVNYLITIRNLPAIIESTNDPDWSHTKIWESVKDCYRSIGYFAHLRNSYIIKYPLDWYSGRIYLLIESLGLYLTEEAISMFDDNRPREEDWK